MHAMQKHQGELDGNRDSKKLKGEHLHSEDTLCAISRPLFRTCDALQVNPKRHSLWQLEENYLFCRTFNWTSVKGKQVGNEGRIHEKSMFWDKTVHSSVTCSANPRQVRFASAWSIRTQTGQSFPEQSCSCSNKMNRQEASMIVSNIRHSNAVAKRCVKRLLEILIIKTNLGM